MFTATAAPKSCLCHLGVQLCVCLMCEATCFILLQCNPAPVLYVGFGNGWEHLAVHLLRIISFTKLDYR